MSVRNYLSLSTKHLSEKAVGFLSSMPQTKALTVRDQDSPGDHMVFLDLAAKDEESLRVLKEVPADLADVIFYAADKSCDLILFAENEEIEPFLPILS